MRRTSVPTTSGHRTSVRTATVRTIGTVAAAALLLAGCGSSDSSSSTTSAATTAAVAGFTAPASMTPASTAAGGSAGGSDEVTLDGTSVAWFTTYCSGITSLSDLSSTASASSGGELGTYLTSAGGVMTQTATALQGKKAPTFDGGEEFATRAHSALSTIGTQMSDLGSTASALAPTDTAGLQQVTTELGRTLQSGAGDLTLDPAVQEAVVAQVPGCDVLGSGTAAGSASTAPSS